MNIKIQEREEKTNMKIVGTYISGEMYSILQKEADESFTSVSSIVRKALYKYLNPTDKDFKNC